MAEGPGKYDKHALRIIREESARGVVVMVIGGKRGQGISCKVTGADRDEALRVHQLLPSLLRAVADAMEAEYGGIEPSSLDDSDGGDQR